MFGGTLLLPPMGVKRPAIRHKKPLGVLNRIVKVHSSPGDTLLDFFAGSGTLGESAALHNRSSILIDNNIPGIKIIMDRLAFYGVELINADYAALCLH